MRRIQEEHEVKALNAEISLRRVVSAPSVPGDVDLLRRVIENLVENAIRHAPAGTEVVLRSEPCTDAVEILVADAGPGISPELRSKIFERFVQLDFGERVVTRTGRGLGLAFCKLAVEAHGGTIHIDDGQPGAIFRVRLPHGQ